MPSLENPRTVNPRTVAPCSRCDGVDTQVAGRGAGGENAIPSL